MAFGLTPEGLVIKTLAVIEGEIDDTLKGVFGKGINTTDQAIFGQIKGIFSEREAFLWDLLEAIYNSQYPDTAEGVSLDNVVALTATERLDATLSLISGQGLFGTATTIIPAGTVFSVIGNPLARFLTSATVTLGVGVNEIQTVSFSATPTSGEFKLVHKGVSTVAIDFSEGAAEVEAALNGLDELSGVSVAGSFVAGFTITFAGDDGLQPQPQLTSTDNTLDDGGPVTIIHATSTEGEFQAAVDMVAETDGPVVATSETLTVIETPISGLVSTFNPEDAAVGRDEEADPPLKIRRRDRLQISIAGPVEAIRNALLGLNDIEGSVQLENVVVFENITTIVDARGLPPKSFEAVIFQAGESTARDQEIADTIYLVAKPAGIEPFGDVSVAVTDSQGFVFTSKFSRPDSVDIFLELDLTVNALYPTDGDDQVKDIMVEFGNDLGTGANVIIFPTLVAQLEQVPGIIDVVIRIDRAPAPTTDDNIIIDDGTGGDVEISRWDTSRITVTS